MQCVDSVYSSLATSWDHLRAHARPWWSAYRRFVPEGARVLDAGCGNGRLLETFYGHCINYTGIDASVEMIDLARARHDRPFLHVRPPISDIRFLICDMCSLSSANGSFDVVFCLAAFHHLETVEDRRRSLKEFHRVLRPRGILIVETWNLRAVRFLWRYKNWRLLFGRSGDSSISWAIQGRQPLVRFYHSCTVRELSRLVNDAGFKVQWCEYRTKGERRGWYNGDELCCGALA